MAPASAEPRIPIENRQLPLRDAALLNSSDSDYDEQFLSKKRPHLSPKRPSACPTPVAHVGLIKRSVEEPSLTTEIRILPGKLECGTQCEILTDEMLQRDVVLPFLKRTNKLEFMTLGFAAHFKQMGEGINALRLHVEGQDETVSAFADHFKVWLCIRLLKLNKAYLMSHGEDNDNFALDFSTTNGCSVANILRSCGEKIETVEADGQLQWIVQEPVLREICSNVMKLKEQMTSGQHGKTKVTVEDDPRSEDKGSFSAGVALVLREFAKECHDANEAEHASEKELNEQNTSSSQGETVTITLGVDEGLGMEVKYASSREELQVESYEVGTPGQHKENEPIVVPAVGVESTRTATNKSRMATTNVGVRKKKDTNSVDKLVSEESSCGKYIRSSVASITRNDDAGQATVRAMEASKDTLTTGSGFPSYKSNQAQSLQKDTRSTRGTEMSSVNGADSADLRRYDHANQFSARTMDASKKASNSKSQSKKSHQQLSVQSKIRGTKMSSVNETCSPHALSADTRQSDCGPGREELPLDGKVPRKKRKNGEFDGCPTSGSGREEAFGDNTYRRKVDSIDYSCYAGWG